MICEKRSTTPLTPKSGEHEDHIAPKEEEAINASTASIELGMYAATLSFFLILVFFKNLDILLTLRFSSCQLLSSRKPFSLTNVIALSLLFFDSRFSAKFSFEFGKNLFL